MFRPNKTRPGRSIALILAGVIAVILSGCSGPRPPDYVEVRPRTLNPGDELPIVVGDGIIEISGGAVKGSPVMVDIPLLEALGTVKYRVNDPYERAEVEYEGVLLTNVFDQFGGADAKSVAITAIDDYLQVIPREHAEKWPVLLAFKVNGIYAERSHRGPAMIVYPYDQYPELAPATYDPLWVWQISHIEFK